MKKYRRSQKISCNYFINSDGCESFVAFGASVRSVARVQKQMLFVDIDPMEFFATSIAFESRVFKVLSFVGCPSACRFELLWAIIAWIKLQLNSVKLVTITRQQSTLNYNNPWYLKKIDLVNLPSVTCSFSFWGLEFQGGLFSGGPGDLRGL